MEIPERRVADASLLALPPLAAGEVLAKDGKRACVRPPSPSKRTKWMLAPSFFFSNRSYAPSPCGATRRRVPGGSATLLNDTLATFRQACELLRGTGRAA